MKIKMNQTLRKTSTSNKNLVRTLKENCQELSGNDNVRIFPRFGWRFSHYFLNQICVISTILPHRCLVACALTLQWASSDITT